MKRKISDLSSQTFDLLIVGSGIYGATAAWDAATRGLSVALIDQGDFGGATSANSLKIVHGGLRYLQQMDVIRMRESIRERRLMLQTAPHLVHPLSCVMPTYGHMIKGPEVMRIGLLLNDIISYDRNRLDDPQKHLPMGKVLSRDALIQKAPGIERQGINGGVLWTDAQMFNSDRLITGFVQSAVSSGAVACNYVRAEAFIRTGNRIQGARCTDVLSGDAFEIRSKVLLNMTGGWTDELLSRSGSESRRVQLSTAMNIIVNRPLLSECAAGVRGRFEYQRPDGETYSGHRILFMTPWREYTVIGTYHRPYEGKPDDLKVTEEEVEGFLKEVNSAYPLDPVQREDVSLVHKGFLPMDGIHKNTGDVVLTKHYHIHDHEQEEQLKGLLSVVGVKYTTARDVSEKAVDRVYAKLGLKKERNRSRHLRIAGGDINRFEALLSEALKNHPKQYNTRVMDHLVKNYGSGYRQYVEPHLPDGQDNDLLPGSAEVLKSEITLAVRDEMAMRLTDVVLRRTDLGSGGYPGDDAVQAAASLMMPLRGWDTKTRDEEISRVQAHYRRMGAVLP